MKRLVGILATLCLILSSWGFVSLSQAWAVELSYLTSNSSLILAVRRNAADDKLSEVGRKLDLNNSDVRDFRQFRGFYPTLATKIIQNSPYEKVEDVLEIPGLSETQKQRLQANLDNFIVTEKADVFNAGDDRINPGVY
ncbi:photosystem II complex extrinsic protein PsbU [Pleurocapsales cyanobacterium LEGE 06147]|nr:photosystem II complex extrinsic protein PsbU [Pleurocapsales cyanobacterium LEGE 06147]